MRHGTFYGKNGNVPRNLECCGACFKIGFIGDMHNEKNNGSMTEGNDEEHYLMAW